MAQSDADKIVRAINNLTAELKRHRRPLNSKRLSEPSLEYPDDSGYDCD